MFDWSNIKVVVLDRDGVINHDSEHYIKSADEWLPIAGSLAAIAKLKQQFKVAIATNQSGIGRGYYSEQVLDQMHNKMNQLLAEHQTSIDHIEFCPHHPDDACQCRKPKPLMLQRIADKFEVQPEQMIFIGDSASDYETAQAFGCDFILVLTGKGLSTLNKLAATPSLTVKASLAKIVEEL